MKLVTVTAVLRSLVVTTACAASILRVKGIRMLASGTVATTGSKTCPKKYVKVYLEGYGNLEKRCKVTKHSYFCAELPPRFNIFMRLIISTFLRMK